MLKFFKKIRRSALMGNRFSKYLLYAIGEIVLVVAGILIALAINSHQQFKKDRSTELNNLVKFSNDLTQDSLLLQQLIIREQQISSDIDTLFNLLKAGDESMMMKVYQKSQSVGYSSIFSGNTGTYDESVATGTMQTILNDSLRSEIFTYYKLVKNNVNDNITDTYQKNEIVPELIDRIASSREPVRIFANIENPNLPSLSIKSLFADPGFNKILVWRKVNCGILMENWNSFLAENSKLQRRIKTEIRLKDQVD